MASLAKSCNINSMFRATVATIIVVGIAVEIMRDASCNSDVVYVRCKWAEYEISLNEY